MDIKELPLSSVCMKAVHNSYNPSKQGLLKQLTFDLEHPYRGGCCGIELDIVQAAGWSWSVQHGGAYRKAESAQLSTYLSRLDEWSLAAGHDHAPVFLHLDLKNASGSDIAFCEEFDGYIRAAMPHSQFYTPGDLLGGEATLLAAARNGWPSVGRLWGHFICCISGSQLNRTWTYTMNSLAARLCFVDRDVNEVIERGDYLPSDQPNRLIYNFRYDRLNRIRQLAPPEYRPALLFRVYEVNDHLSWQRAQRLGVNLIATDQVFFTSWACVSRTGPVAQFA